MLFADGWSPMYDKNIKALTESVVASVIMSKYSRCLRRKTSSGMPSADNRVTNSALSLPNTYGLEYSSTDNVSSGQPANLHIDFLKWTSPSIFCSGFTIRTPLYPRYRI